MERVPVRSQNIKNGFSRNLQEAAERPVLSVRMKEQSAPEGSGSMDPPRGPPLLWQALPGASVSWGGFGKEATVRAACRPQRGGGGAGKADAGVWRGESSRAALSGLRVAVLRHSKF